MEGPVGIMLHRLLSAEAQYLQTADCFISQLRGECRKNSTYMKEQRHVKG